MSFLPEELKRQTFPCPNCKQYIFSEVDICKFCSFQIPDNLKQISIESELNEKKRINLNRHRNFLLIGIALLILGAFSIITPIIQINYSNNVNINCLTPIFVITGIVITAKSFVDYRREKKKF